LSDAGFAKPRGDAMPNVQTTLVNSTPSIVPGDIPDLSDDECLLLLVQTMEGHDSGQLDELARLIGLSRAPILDADQRNPEIGPFLAA